MQCNLHIDASFGAKINCHIRNKSIGSSKY